MICSSVTAGNNYKQERQFRSLYDEANSRKKVSCFRNGKVESLGGEELVVGDIVKLQEGMEIPADGYVLEGHEVTCDESAMTGETDPMKKAVMKECLEKRESVKKEQGRGGHDGAGHHAVPSPILFSGTRVQELRT
jgi:Ca2+ transporting ATPase